MFFNQWFGQSNMNIFEGDCIGFVPSPDQASFHEQWVSGTYIVVGVFPYHVEHLTPSHIRQDIPSLFEQTRHRKRALWPKGICAYYLIPIYCSDTFSQETIDWVSKRPTYRWAIWHEPVLFNTRENNAHTNMNWGLYCSAFRQFLVRVFVAGVCTLSRKYKFSSQPVLNGNRIEEKDDPTIKFSSTLPPAHGR